MTGIVPAIRRASTVALLRAGLAGPEVLLTHRPASMAFGPGLHVFPGGAVDPGDGEEPLVSRSALDPIGCAAPWAGDPGPSEAIAHAVAAVRELYEEAGVLLATTRSGMKPDAGTVGAAHRAGEPLAGLAERLDLVLRTDRLVALSHWVTPPVGVGRRYDTRFYVAALEDATGLRPRGREVAAHEWLTPAAALEARADGRIDLWPPTSTTLAQLAPARGMDEIRRWLVPVAPAGGPVATGVAAGIVRVRASGAGGIPGVIVNAYLIGRRRAVVVDPGDPGEEAIEAILAAVAAHGVEVSAVILTSPVPDRAGGALILAERVGGVPVLAAGAGLRATGALVGGPVHGLEDGDAVTLGDLPLVVMATPGTHPGHLAFSVPAADAVVVGDLEGPGPSGRIPVPRDAGALERSLARVRAIPAAHRLRAYD